jgi:hypothetical protein
MMKSSSSKKADAQMEAPVPLPRLALRSPHMRVSAALAKRMKRVAKTNGFTLEIEEAEKVIAAMMENKFAINGLIAMNDLALWDMLKKWTDEMPFQDVEETWLKQNTESRLTY